jgi:hypothetical protein
MLPFWGAKLVQTCRNAKFSATLFLDGYKIMHHIVAKPKKKRTFAARNYKDEHRKHYKEIPLLAAVPGSSVVSVRLVHAA